MPTLDELADRLVRVERALGLTPGPTTPSTPTKPTKPTGLTCTPQADGRLVLTWDTAADAAGWEVRDELDPVTPVKDTVAVPRSVRSAFNAFRPSGRPRRYTVVALGARGSGRSEPSDPLDWPPAGPTPSPGPTPQPAPGTGGADLSRWKLTIPELAGGKVVEIRPPVLATYSDRYFTRLLDGSLRFRCWHGGATTSGSANPRSELRERVGDDPEGYWDAGHGRHVMEWSGRVERLTKVKPHTVLGQVHDDRDDVAVWRVEGDKLWLTDGDNPHGYLVDDAFALGKPYTCRYEIVDGRYSFTYNGRVLDYSIRSTAPSYFKVGAYLQSNPKSAPAESGNEYTEVVVARLTITHTT